MATYTTRMEKSGRILVPVEVRRQLGLSEGATVIVKVHETSGALEIKSRLQVLDEVRKRLREYIPAGSDLAGELIREREAEAEREAAEASDR